MTNDFSLFDKVLISFIMIVAFLMMTFAYILGA